MTSGQKDYQVYFKSKLVPGPEMFPFKDFLFFLKPIIDKLGGTIEGHTKQVERGVFSGGPLNVAPIICYESIYGDYTGGYVRKGATAFLLLPMMVGGTSHPVIHSILRLEPCARLNTDGPLPVVPTQAPLASSI